MFEEYVRLHRIMTDLTTTSIYDSLKNGTDLDLSNVPDEVFDKIRAVQKDILRQFDELKTECENIVSELNGFGFKTRKEYAECLLHNYNKKHQAIVFAIRC